MRATGRRIGRIVGQLDDLVIQMETYIAEERRLSEDATLTTTMLFLRGRLVGAHTLAEDLATYLNARDRPTGEPLAKR